MKKEDLLYMRSPSKSRGFLPTVDPLEKFENHDYKWLDQLGKDLPKLLAEKKFRKRIDEGIHVLDFPLIEIGRSLDRLTMLYSFFASAYVHEDPKNPAKELPYSLSRPLMTLSKKLERPPILSYDSYCLCNWKRKDPNKPISVDNLKLLQNFLGGIDEDWFILIHVDIECKAGKVLAGISSARSDVKLGHSETDLEKSLLLIAEGIYDMNVILDRMPENCSPGVYFHRVRPYIWSFEDVEYKYHNDRKNKRFTYRGETGAQSSIIPAIVAALGIKHEDSMLVQHLKDMRKYMPKQHRNYISTLENGDVNIRATVKKMGEKTKDAYNACVEGLLKFRSTHLQYAIDYIQNKVTNPTGTGGTPYIKWLSKLKDETKEHLL